MKKELFRQTSIDRVNSPEQLNEYIRTSRPSVWIVLGAIVALLAGTIIWSIFGNIETKIVTGAVVEGGKVTCFVPENDYQKLYQGMTLSIGDKEYVVEEVGTTPKKASGIDDESALYFSGLSEDDFFYVVTASANDLSDGTYKSNLIVENIKPMTLLVK